MEAHLHDLVEIAQPRRNTRLKGVDWLIASGALPGLGAASYVGLAAALLDRQLAANVLLLVALVATASYLVDHLADADGRSSTTRWRCALVAMVVGALAARLLLDTAWGYAVAVFYPASVMIYRRVKDVPYAKAAYVPLMWGSLVAVPLVTTPGSSDGSAILLLLTSVTLLMGVAVSACDLRDAAQDRERGLKTLATRFRPSTLLLALQLANGAVVALSLLGMACGVLPAGAFVLIAHSALNALVLSTMGGASASGLRFLTGVVLDGALSLPFFLLLLLRHWELLT